MGAVLSLVQGCGETSHPSGNSQCWASERGCSVSGKWVGQIRGQDPGFSGVKGWGAGIGSRRKRVKGQIPDVLARPISKGEGGRPEQLKGLRSE